MFKERIPIKKILAAGLIVGSLDILSAIIDTWVSYKWTPDKVLKYIAGAAFDKTAFSETFLVVAGLIFHYLIAMGFTFLFYFIYPPLKKLFRYNLVIACLYGIFMQAFMRFLLLPLTRLQLNPFDIGKQIKPTLILTVAIGIPLTLLMQRMYKKQIETKYK